MSNDIRFEARSDPARARAALDGPLPFGKVFADLMVRIQHSAERGWHQAAIVPFGPLSLSPAAKVLHYGQEIFEGLKAYARCGADPTPDAEVALFRPELNARRLNLSARRMVMPEIPEALQLAAIELLVDALRAWVPRAPGTSLYLRPCLLGTDPSLGVAPSRSHLYLVLASPVGAYFQPGAAGISVFVEPRELRAFPGGVGAAKTGGNYAAGLQAQERAHQAGYDQVLFLDGREPPRLQELNGMNLFLVRDGTLLTPPLGDTVLDGVTRRSILELAPELGIPAEERELTLAELLGGVERGAVTEVLAVGTGAAITPVAVLGVRGGRLRVGAGRPGPTARRLQATLAGIQHGALPDAHGWTRLVPRHADRGAAAA